MSIGFILFLCDIDSIYTMFFLILLVILYGPRVCNKRLNYLNFTQTVCLLYQNSKILTITIGVLRSSNFRNNLK